MSFNIEIKEKRESDAGYVFSISIQDMPINNVEELHKLPNMIRKEFRNYMNLYFGTPKEDSLENFKTK